MATSYPDIDLGDAWLDLCEEQTAIASVAGTVIQNVGGGTAMLYFGGASAPVGDMGLRLLPGQHFIDGRGSAHIWARGPGRVAVSTGIGINHVNPALTLGGQILLNTSSSNGSNWQAFGDNACTQFTVVNDTGTTLELRQGSGGATFRLADGDRYSFYGIANTSDIQARRADLSAMVVVIKGRWEAP